MVSSLRTDDYVMHKRRTIFYTLADGQKVTCRQVADEIGISESAARNRLIRSDDPAYIFKPYSVKNGGKPRGKQKKPKVVLPYEDDMWKLVMKMGTKNYD